MTDLDCVGFLQWALPRLNMRWKGFRKVRRRVCRRIQRRIDELGLESIEDYKQYLEGNYREWRLMDSYCRITISRFYRDRGLFNTLSRDILPLLKKMIVKGEVKELRCWSAGCASGEEPYTLKIIWDNIVALDPNYPAIRITATDIDQGMLDRAKTAVYSPSSFWELPYTLFRRAFFLEDNSCILRDEFRGGVTFLKQDIRRDIPEEIFHLVLCRNLVFTYFDETLQREVLKKIVERLLPGGFLIVGCHEKVLADDLGLKVWRGNPMVYQKL